MLPSSAPKVRDGIPASIQAGCQASADTNPAPPRSAGTGKLSGISSFIAGLGALACGFSKGGIAVGRRLTGAEPRSHGIFGVPLRQSITYANVAISLVDEDGKSYIYGYVPIVVAKCGVFLKEKGASGLIVVNLGAQSEC